MSMTGTFQRARDPNEPRYLTNTERTNKDRVLAAAAASGQAVEWRDEPSSAMPPSMRAEYGSVWSAERDCSRFWDEYRKLEDAALSSTKEIE